MAPAIGPALSSLRSPGDVQLRCFDGTVPGTALVNLLAAGSFEHLFDAGEVYRDDNLGRVPDINITGANFYTLWYYTVLDPTSVCVGKGVHSPRLFLHLRGINYRAEVFVNGRALPPLEAPAAVGMFHRWTFPLTRCAALLSESGGIRGLGVAVVVRPPDFPGAPCAPDSPSPCGQGGDHQIARTAAVMQSAAGWDWVQPTPDRNTGIWDQVSVIRTGKAMLRDGFVCTLSLALPPVDEDPLPSVAPEASALASVTVRNVDDEGVWVHVLVTLSERSLLDDGVTTALASTPSAPVFLLPGEERSIAVHLDGLRDVAVWWPFTHGASPLYSVRFDAVVRPSDHEDGVDAVSHSLQVRHGFRTISTWVDPGLGGRVFAINGRKVFLQGGNWITTDQFLRFAGSRERYQEEVELHRAMGLNLIRVWGGGITERPEFFDACDELGVLVLQEFWCVDGDVGVCS